MVKIALGSIREATQPDCIRALVIEYVVTFLFVFIGVGTAMASNKLDAGSTMAGCSQWPWLTTTPIISLASDVGYLQGVIWEVVLTFTLLFSVYATIVNPKKGALNGLGPTLVGLVVAANTLAGGAYSGAAINPARAFARPSLAGTGRTTGSAEDTF
ncbi:hypothetical protein MLD38_015245 [Melastoma candidum]|uniref:Uncharacterized protein n=1 Tax=Melastoma candidum TaxID=119954 RepID=A0ACB9RHC6_9MYRT|nr:hypothetical protein MLD38_015245 [Melastoma candidum]